MEWNVESPGLRMVMMRGYSLAIKALSVGLVSGERRRAYPPEAFIASEPCSSAESSCIKSLGPLLRDALRNRGYRSAKGSGGFSVIRIGCGYLCRRAARRYRGFPPPWPFVEGPMTTWAKGCSTRFLSSVIIVEEIMWQL
jgi:hypothetical protein